VSHGIPDTHGYILLKYCKYMYIKYEKKLNNKEKLKKIGGRGRETRGT
jgi:hypothetical protein